MFNSNQGGASKLNNITHQQLEIIRSKYIGQNRSLAKVNSSLLSKIAFLETKLNQLFKDYIKLKNDKVTGTHNLNSVLDELEKECVLKFGEIFDKIDDIRVENNIEPLSNISIKTSNDDNVSPDLPLVNARRKTRRRESMVIPQGEEPVLDDVQQQQQEEPIKSEADMSNGIGNRSQQHTITELSIPELDEDEFDKDEQDFLRMKENFEKQKTAIQLSNKPGRKEKKSNFKVFQDHK
ncbi:hypothetical protein PACTADRAFT_663 [Pachysolen tannophilus NRRL Y-2460]|uniref:Shugoshin N-terminal coiled-coil domain-containing protein n=1 Tax=Pachysolen tannophilus NRRL Y-2460 TaxID=669874 RepID=A0A1E4U2Q7_PACTA|nr:hypothetical protein PACTADRAFT_663 [Pachysolen tannophilus NRRL Y-2460]